MTTPVTGTNDPGGAVRQEIIAERRFVIERSFQFLNFGIITLGLGLGAIFSEQAKAYRTPLATLLAVLFLGATWVGIFSWRTYGTLRRQELEAAAGNSRYAAPSYSWLFFSGVGFGALATGLFTWIALSGT